MEFKKGRKINIFDGEEKERKNKTLATASRHWLLTGVENKSAALWGSQSSVLELKANISMLKYNEDPNMLFYNVYDVDLV